MLGCDKLFLTKQAQKNTLAVQKYHGLAQVIGT
jgi:hypothetical protein